MLSSVALYMGPAIFIDVDCSCFYNSCRFTLLNQLHSVFCFVVYLFKYYLLGKYYSSAPPFSNDPLFNLL